jgi:hypothetical protein
VDTNNNGIYFKIPFPKCHGGTAIFDQDNQPLCLSLIRRLSCAQVTPASGSVPRLMICADCRPAGLQASSRMRMSVDTAEAEAEPDAGPLPRATSRLWLIHRPRLRTLLEDRDVGTGRALTLVYDTQSYWGSGLCPSSGTLKTTKQRSRPQLTGPSERDNLNHWTFVLSKGPNRIHFCSSREAGHRLTFRNVAFPSEECRLLGCYTVLIL